MDHLHDLLLPFIFFSLSSFFLSLSSSFPRGTKTVIDLHFSFYFNFLTPPLPRSLSLFHSQSLLPKKEYFPPPPPQTVFFITCHLWLDQQFFKIRMEKTQLYFEEKRNWGVEGKDVDRERERERTYKDRERERENKRIRGGNERTCLFHHLLNDDEEKMSNPCSTWLTLLCIMRFPFLSLLSILSSLSLCPPSL